MENLNLAGKGKFIGKKIFLNGMVILFNERKKDLEKKPKHYLYLLKPKKYYISSLFQIDKNKFNFDFNSKAYELNIEGESATIVDK